MKQFLAIHLCAGLFSFFCSGASAGTITFGNVAPDTTINNFATYVENVDGFDYTFTPTSPLQTFLVDQNLGANFASDFLAITDTVPTNVVTLTSTAGAFNLTSLYAGSGSASAVDLLVTGYIGAMPAFTFPLMPPVSFLGSDPATLLTLNWTNLSKVEFSTTATGVNSIGLDDLVVTAFAPPGPTAVPEPATASLLGLGTMIGAFCQYRRRKRAV